MFWPSDVRIFASNMHARRPKYVTFLGACYRFRPSVCLVNAAAQDSEANNLRSEIATQFALLTHHMTLLKRHLALLQHHMALSQHDMALLRKTTRKDKASCESCHPEWLYIYYMYLYTNISYIHIHICLYVDSISSYRMAKVTGCLNFDVTFHKSASIWRAFLRKTTCKDKASCEFCFHEGVSFAEEPYISRGDCTRIIFAAKSIQSKHHKLYFSKWGLHLSFKLQLWRQGAYVYRKDYVLCIYKHWEETIFITHPVF